MVQSPWWNEIWTENETDHAWKYSLESTVYRSFSLSSVLETSVMNPSWLMTGGDERNDLELVWLPHAD